MLKDIAPKAKAGGVQRARKLRKAMTLPEVLLWGVLKQRPHGLKSRRQHGSGPYIFDFHCSDARLAIEVDGMAHDQVEHDARRDAWALNQGIRTLRVPASDLLADVERTAEMIVDSARAALPLHHPAAPGGPPPPDKLGED